MNIVHTNPNAHYTRTLNMPEYVINYKTKEMIATTIDEPKIVYEKLIHIAQQSELFLIIAKYIDNNEYSIYSQNYFEKHYPNFNVTQNTLNLMKGTQNE